MRILSDFDGVWTDQAREGEALLGFFAAEAARVARRDADAALADCRRFLARALAAPERFGWAPDGRITAYVDEDPLLHTAGVAGVIAEAVEPGAREWRDAIVGAGFASLPDFAHRCFDRAMQAIRGTHADQLVGGARGVLELLRARGHEVVVVSNSPPEKIEAWFTAAGIACRGAGALLRVRGHAGKWVLGGDARIEVDGRPIYADRPRYRAVIEEERADLAIGDVFSLDLALPSEMRRARAAGAPAFLVLRRHAHTPRWVLEGLAGGRIDRAVNGVDALPDLCDELAAARGAGR